MTELTADQLIAESLRLKDHVEAQSREFARYLKPYNDRQEEIRNLLLAKLNEQGLDKFSGDSGTAYISEILNVKITDRDKLLDLCNEHWGEFGNEMLLVSAQKDAVKTYMETHEGHPPVGVETSYFRRLNIKRS